MLRKILFVVLLVMVSNAIAQKSTASPYSYIGFGEMVTAQTVENQAMGGVSIYTDSIHMNLNNPSHLAKLRITNYSMGLSTNQVGINTSSEKVSSGSTQIEYLSLAFPVAKNTAFGFGVLPYTAMDYRLYTNSTSGENTTVNNVFSGDGNLNRLYFSLGTSITKNFQVGASLYTNFGTINKQRIQSLDSVLLGTIDRKSSHLRGVNYNFSANYTLPINDKLEAIASYIYTTETHLNSENTQEIGTISLATGTDMEIQAVDLGAQGLDKTTLRLPSTSILGLSIGQERKWFLGAQYLLQDLTQLSNDFFSQQNVSYQKRSSLRLGGFYIPNYSNFSTYMKRVVYRGGINLTQTGYVINGKEIKDFGMSFGLGLPIGGSVSNINATLTVGSQGTTDANLIKENYIKLKLGLSFNDFWFVKRKIN